MVSFSRSGYGPIFEVWFDGANGGDGYYGGDRTTHRIDPRSYYDWENTWKLVRELQPEACMFSDIGPDVRWVGNESGVAGDPCWATFSPENYAIGGTPGEVLNRGERTGTRRLIDGKRNEIVDLCRRYRVRALDSSVRQSMIASIRRQAISIFLSITRP